MRERLIRAIELRIYYYNECINDINRMRVPDTTRQALLRITEQYLEIARQQRRDVEANRNIDEIMEEYEL